MNADLADRLLDRAEAIALAQRDASKPAPDPYDRSAFFAALRDDALSLAAAVRFGEPGLFADYATSTGLALRSRGIGANAIAQRFENLGDGLVRALGRDAEPLNETYLAPALAALGNLKRTQDELRENSQLDETSRPFFEALLAGDLEAGGRILRKDAFRGIAMEEIYLHVIAPSLREVGRRWELNQISPARDLIFSAGAIQLLTEINPLLQGSTTRENMLVACAVSGEEHEIGIRMVCDFYRMKNWYVHYAGANVPIGDIVEFTIESRADVLALSVSTLKNLGACQRIVALLRNREEHWHTRVLVGGRPFNISPQLWRKVGADGSALDASGALRLGEVS
jgi:methanogenic corrinoid protein MtbC1